MQFQKDDLFGTWELEDSGERYVLARSATITAGTEDYYGITGDIDNSEVFVFGDIRAEEYFDSSAIYLTGTATDLVVGRQSEVAAWSSGYGVYLEGSVHFENQGTVGAGQTGLYAYGNTDVVNRGTIEAGGTGIELENGAVSIDNFGSISAFVGIDVEDDVTSVHISNAASAEIRGTGYGIYLESEAPAQIVNRGLIHGGDVAIHAEGAARIVNRGRISGDIELGADNDHIDTRKGTVDGAIRGGEGDDTYIISSRRIVIDDTGASYSDAVISEDSYRLVGGLDNLYVFGDRDVAGIGNIGDNTIHGNAGDNRLSGMEGADSLWGRGGNDMLTGGSGGDYFIFGQRNGVDTVTDFEDGIDLIDHALVRSPQDFDSLSIRSDGDDVVIEFGRGEQLILLDMQKSALTFDDFAVP